MLRRWKALDRRLSNADKVTIEWIFASRPDQFRAS
jgi:hypothetical protein